jgi:mono/diheme cytochrome c family protein/peroxiredoxin
MSAGRDPAGSLWKRRGPKAALIVLAAIAAERWAEWAVTEIIEGWRAPVAARQAKEAFVAASSRGELLYRVHCNRCHGPSGRGDGPDAATFKTPPHDLATTTSNWSNDRIRATIVEGKSGTPMLAFGQAFSDRQLDDLVAHLRSFRLPSSREAFERERARLAERLRRAGFDPEARIRPAPRLEIRDDQGRITTLAQLRGRLVLLAFWGASCTPCRKELPDLKRLADRFRDAGLALLPVCVDTVDPAEARAALEGQLEDIPAACDMSGRARLEYDIQVLPTAVLIDRWGDLIGYARGGRNWSAPEINDLMETCLRQQ